MKPFLIIVFVAVSWVAAMSVDRQLSDLVVWGVPAAIIAAYIGFALWKFFQKSEFTSKKPHKPEFKPKWWQLSVEVAAYIALTLIAIALLQNILAEPTVLHLALIGVVCWTAVHFLFRQLLWKLGNTKSQEIN